MGSFMTNAQLTTQLHPFYKLAPAGLPNLRGISLDFGHMALGHSVFFISVITDNLSELLLLLLLLLAGREAHPASRTMGTGCLSGVGKG
jgi:hypothetical protein